MTEPAAIVREDAELIAFTVEQTAERLSTLLFARRITRISYAQRLALIQACSEFVHAQIDEHVPQPEIEPCAMSAAKAEAEA